MRPRRFVDLDRNSMASASDVLPTPWWATNATLRICEAANRFKRHLPTMGETVARFRGPPGGTVRAEGMRSRPWRLMPRKPMRARKLTPRSGAGQDVACDGRSRDGVRERAAEDAAIGRSASD